MRFALPFFALLAASPAFASVESATADGFLVRHEVMVPVDSKTAFAELVHPEHWWNDAHTWSGSAANLSLDPRAGGCWCERWAKGEAEHGVVIRVVRDESLRVRAAFGPLQDMALNGVFDLTLSHVEGGTKIVATYRINGPASANLDKLAAPVDGVIGEQVERLRQRLAGETK
ncbi:MAG: hypothetical protein ACREO3_10445 [Arenimonas sp.]